MIDITELLEEYVLLMEKGGIPKESTESKLMLESSKEIRKLREQLEFQIKLADDNNNSRLRLLDVISNCRELYESTCKHIRDMTGEDYVCGMCRWDCDTSVGLSGEPFGECPGFEKDDCFELNVIKFNDIVFRKDKEE